MVAAALCLASLPLPHRRGDIPPNTGNLAGAVRRFPAIPSSTNGASIPLTAASPKFVLLSSHRNHAALSESPNVSAGVDDDLPKYPPSELIAESGKLLINEHQSKLMDDLADEYVNNIRNSRVYSIAEETPLEKAARLFERTGINFWMKREDLQPVFSFKLRGAYNMMANLPLDQRKKVITASAGNHAQGVAMSATQREGYAVVCMPETAPQIKQDAVKRLGGNGKYVELDLCGQTFDEAQEHALQRAADKNLIYVPPYDDMEVIFVQGTIGMEILKQTENERIDVDAVFVPIGGGGLVSGIATYIKSVKPEVNVIGVEPANANSMAIALDKDQRITLTETDTIADGVAVKTIGQRPFWLSRTLIDGVVLVSDELIAGAIKDVYDENRVILEPSGAVALAGAQAYCNYYKITSGNFVTVMSGANMDFEKIPQVVEIAEIGRGHEALVATAVPEKKGSLKKFLDVLGNVNISEFSYRGDPNKDSALLMYKIGINSPSDLDAIIGRLKAGQFQTINLSGNNIVHNHLKNASGGRANNKDEVLARFVLPEKRGSLKELVELFSPDYNISLLNYRYEGDIKANVLVGLQVPSPNLEDFHNRAVKLKYPYKICSDNEGFKFLNCW